jgi:hypothetical protein
LVLPQIPLVKTGAGAVKRALFRKK